MNNQTIQYQFVNIEQPEDIEKILSFMEAASGAFNSGDYEKYRDLSYSYIESSERNGREFIIGLMKSGLRIIRWTAKPFSEPTWPIFKTLKLCPEPIFWIDVFLNDGLREKDYQLYFALPANADVDGVFKKCAYIERQKPKRAKSSSKKKEV